MPPRSRTPAPRAAADGPDLTALFHDLVQLETSLWNAVEGPLHAEHGLTLPSFEFMQVIVRTPGRRVRDIAAALGLTVGGTSKLVDRLEAAGYCARTANPGDRRSSIVTLTPAGKRTLPKVAATVDSELRARLGSQLPMRSLAQLGKTLARLRAAETA